MPAFLFIRNEAWQVNQTAEHIGQITYSGSPPVPSSHTGNSPVIY